MGDREEASRSLVLPESSRRLAIRRHLPISPRPGATRTPNIRIRSPAVYPLAYEGKKKSLNQR